MRTMRSFAAVMALSLVLGAAPSYAQGTKPPAAGAEQPAPAQPRPFPEGSSFAFINIQRIAAESGEGKASTAKVQALNQQKVAQLNEMNKKLQADQEKLRTQASVMSEAARAQLEREIDRQTKEVQRFTQDAQEDVQNLQQDLQNAFQSRLLPVIQKVVAERKIQMLFSQNDAGIVWADPGLDITADVIKRFDAANPAPATQAPVTPPAANPPAAPAGQQPPAAKPPQQ